MEKTTVKVNVFSLLYNCMYFPLENVKVLHLNKSEFPLARRMICAKFG